MIATSAYSLGTLLLVAFGGVVVAGLGLALCYRQVGQGEALVVQRLDGVDASLNGAFYIPGLHRVQVMDLSLTPIPVEHRGNDGLVCADNVYADLKVTFYLRVGRSESDVCTVAESGTWQPEADSTNLEELFAHRLSEALETAVAEMRLQELWDEREPFRDHLIEVAGRNLDGYIVDDVAIDHLEATPIGALDLDDGAPRVDEPSEASSEPPEAHDPLVHQAAK